MDVERTTSLLGKSEFFSVVYYTKMPCLENVWGNGDVVPHILLLGTRWRRVVSFTLRTIYLQGKPPVPFYRRLSRPQILSGRCEKKDNPLSLSAIEPHSCKWRDIHCLHPVVYHQGGLMWGDSAVYTKISHRCFLLSPFNFIKHWWFVVHHSILHNCCSWHSIVNQSKIHPSKFHHRPRF
jgi:hypothetical protein